MSHTVWPIPYVGLSIPVMAHTGCGVKHRCCSQFLYENIIGILSMKLNSVCSGMRDLIYWDDIDHFSGADYATVDNVSSADQCTQVCFDDANCHAFTYVPERGNGHCYKKHAAGYRSYD